TAQTSEQLLLLLVRRASSRNFIRDAVRSVISHTGRIPDPGMRIEGLRVAPGVCELNSAQNSRAT
ncbi:hypothetical protein, partial [Streptomyces sp. ISID311]|uniref:hypothetical protein n=1 Tax=Streptomyces sp. ISID311 TaxID=2601673 RepID=UPI001C9A5DAA